MSDEKKQPESADHDDLPESIPADNPKDSTLMSRSGVVKRVITSLQREVQVHHQAASLVKDADGIKPGDESQTDTEDHDTTEPDVHEQDVVLADSGDSQMIPAQSTPRVVDSSQISQGLTRASQDPPWTLQQFFDGEIDLDVELSRRFPTVPLLSTIRFRTLGTVSGRRVAMLSTQDSAASLVIEADAGTKVVQMAFTMGSMITLRFTFGDMSDRDRMHWLDLMRRDEGGLSFLWGPSRWTSDYAICITRTYFTNLYAFSPHNFEAAVRMTPAVLDELLDWLEAIWTADDEPDDEPPELLTW